MYMTFLVVWSTSCIQIHHTMDLENASLVQIHDILALENGARLGHVSFSPETAYEPRNTVSREFVNRCIDCESIGDV